MNKLRAAQVGFVVNFENKLRDTLKYLIDRVEWPTFCIELSKFANLLQKLKYNEAIVRTIWTNGLKRSRS